MGGKSSKASKVAEEAGSPGKHSGSVIDKLTEAQLDEFREAFNSFDKVRACGARRRCGRRTPGCSSSSTAFAAARCGGAILSTRRGGNNKNRPCRAAAAASPPPPTTLFSHRSLVSLLSLSQDGGGSIDSKELKDLMASVGQNPTDDELAEMIRIADADGTGDIDFAEFVTLMAHKMADEKSEATLKAAFSVFDTSGDGFISAEEMRRIMINVGEPVTLDDVEQVIRKVDIDGDGVINYEEFTKVIIEEKATQFGQAGK